MLARMWFWGVWVVSLSLSNQSVIAQTAAPRILCATPFAIVSGEPTKLALRGLHLDKTKTLRLRGVEPELVLTPKPSKVGVPNGFEAAKVGDQQVECEFTIPAATKIDAAEFVLELETGERTTFKVPVFERAQLIDDKEPNKAFSQAQRLDVGQQARGTIHEARDVDVYRLELKAGQSIVIDVLAERLGTPLDASLMIHDERGRILDSNDDRRGRDPQIEIKLARDGAIFVVVFDANDAGSIVHGYVLRVASPK